jgi:hypothetical protein
MAQLSWSVESEARFNFLSTLEGRDAPQPRVNDGSGSALFAGPVDARINGVDDCTAGGSYGDMVPAWAWRCDVPEGTNSYVGSSQKSDEASVDSLLAAVQGAEPIVYVYNILFDGRLCGIALFPDGRVTTAYSEGTNCPTIS